MKTAAYLFVGMLTLLFEACNNSGTKTSAAAESSATKNDSTALAAATGEMDSNDASFAEKAAVGGMAAVALGKLAAGRTENAQIRQFGQMMVTDHGNANEELKKIAAAKGIRLPTALDPPHLAELDSLSKLNGPDFDRKYVDAMVDGHQKTLVQMQAESKEGRDKDLRDFAIRTGSVVQHHLSIINGISRRMK